MRRWGRGRKAVALIAGVILIAFGLLFAGQGVGIILWPASSFMLAARIWVVYGLVVAARLTRWRVSYTRSIGHNGPVL